MRVHRTLPVASRYNGINLMYPDRLEERRWRRRDRRYVRLIFRVHRTEIIGRSTPGLYRPMAGNMQAAAAAVALVAVLRSFLGLPNRQLLGSLCNALIVAWSCSHFVTRNFKVDSPGLIIFTCCTLSPLQR